MLWVAIATPCYAEETVFRELARKMQNPVSDRISFSFEDRINFGVGLNDDVQNILNIRSLYSFNLGDEWNLINRTMDGIHFHRQLSEPSGQPIARIAELFRLVEELERFSRSGSRR